jgi:general L-amino acid transport system substrate-binding protein
MRAADPKQHLVLPELISKSPYGPAVMPGDLRWMEIVRWAVFAMVDAEELGVSSATVDGAQTSDDPAILRLVGRQGGFGAMLGLDADWAFKIVKQVGNYAESVDRNIKPLGVERGLNRLWRDGGILYVPGLR